MSSAARAVRVVAVCGYQCRDKNSKNEPTVASLTGVARINRAIGAILERLVLLRLPSLLLRAG